LDEIGDRAGVVAAAAVLPVDATSRPRTTPFKSTRSLTGRQSSSSSLRLDALTSRQSSSSSGLRLDRILSEPRPFMPRRAAETATALPSVLGTIEDKALELAVLAKGRELELARLVQQQRKVWQDLHAGARQCQTLVMRKEQLQARLVAEAATGAAAVRAIKENHEIIKRRTRELHLQRVAASHVRASATDSDLFNSQEHQRRLQERRYLDLERKLVSADKALQSDRSKAAHHLVRSATERRRLEAGNDSRTQSLADTRRAEAESDARLQRALALAPSKREFGLLMPRGAANDAAAAAAEGAGGASAGGTRGDAALPPPQWSLSPSPSPRFDLDVNVVGRSVLDVDQFDALRTPEQRRKCLEMLEARFAQLSSLAAHLRRLVGATQSVHADLELPKTLDTIEALACDACEGGGARVLLLDHAPGLLPRLYCFAGDDMHLMAQAGVTARAIAQGRTEVVPDVKRDTEYQAGVDNPMGGGCQSLMLTPIWSEGEGEGEGGGGRRVIGVLQVANKIKGDFNAKDALFAGLLAAMAATAASNARAYADMTRRRHRNRALLDAGRVLASSLDQRTVLDRAAAETRRIMRAERVLLWSLPSAPASIKKDGDWCEKVEEEEEEEGKEGESAFSETCSDPKVDAQMFGGGFEAAARRCVAEARVVAVRDDLSEFSDLDLSLGMRTRSVLCAPVMGTTGRPLGAIVCVNKLPEQSAGSAAASGGGRTDKGGGLGGGRDGGDEPYLPFDADDEEAAGTLAAQVGVALENAILYSRVSQVPDVSGDVKLTLSVSDAGRLVLDRALALCPSHAARLCVVGTGGDEVWCLDGGGGEGAWSPLPSGSVVEQVLTSGKAVNRGGGGGRDASSSASLRESLGTTTAVDLPAEDGASGFTSLLYTPLPLLVAAGGMGGGREESMRAGGVLILANKKAAGVGGRVTGGGASEGIPAFDRMDEYLVGGYLSSAAVVLKAARARELSMQAQAQWAVLFRAMHLLYAHHLDLGRGMPRAPFEAFAAEQVAALLPGVSLRVCWPEPQNEEGRGQPEDDDGEGQGDDTIAQAPVFEDEEAAAAAAQGAQCRRHHRICEGGASLVTHAVAAPVETAAGAVRCCLLASREGGRSFSHAEVEALAVFAGHVGVCMA